jgi:hypothetical protein
MTSWHFLHVFYYAKLLHSKICHETKRVYAWTFFLLVGYQLSVIRNSINYFRLDYDS